MDENHTDIEPTKERTEHSARIEPKKKDRRPWMSEKGTLHKKGRKAGKFLTNRGTADAVALLAQGLPINMVAKQLDVSAPTISQIKQQYQRVFDALPFAADYASIRPSLLTGVEAVALESIAECANNNDNLQRAAYAFKVIYEAGRLERGLSTRNTEAHVHTTTQSFIELSPRKD